MAGISKSKKRYSVSLTPAIVERFQGLLKDTGLPAGTMSSAIDDFLKDMSDVLQMAKDQGSLKLSDIFKLMGKQVELAIDEERRATNEQPKRSSVPNKKKAL